MSTRLSCVQSDGSTSSTGIFPVTGRGSYASCLEMLLLTVKLSWPLTLVFSKRQLLHYQVHNLLGVGNLHCVTCTHPMALMGQRDGRAGRHVHVI